jgi:predicted metal-dependent peptidase
MDMDERLRRIRVSLALRSSFFSCLLAEIPLRENRRIPTAATNGEVIEYNPDFLFSLPLEQQVGVTWHELAHVAFEHPWRLQSFLEIDPEVTNIGADQAINELCPFLLPSGAVRGPSAWRGWPAERRIRELMKEHIKRRGSKATLVPGAGAHDILPPGRGQSAQAAREKVRAAVAKATAIARAMGTMPADLERLLNDLNASRIPWQSYASRFLSELAAADYTWEQPDADYVPAGIYLPSFAPREQVGPLVVGVDTSGSISTADLTKAVSELHGLARQLRPAKLVVMWADADVARVQEFGPDEPLTELRPAGGGGTDFRPVFNAAERYRPAGLIYFTDLEGEFPDRAPAWPVLWVTTGNKTAPFGETVRL